MAKRKRRAPKGPATGLDIIIPVYGRPDLLQKCLDSIAAQTGVDYQIYLVDDQGPEQDQLAEIYKAQNGSARLMRNKENLGFARTVNRGVALGRAPLVLILNSDVEMKPGALAAMVAEFDNPKVGVVGPKLLFPEDSTDPTRPAGRVQHAGLAVNFRGKIIHPNIGWSADHPTVNRHRNCQAVTGACLMTRREVWGGVYKMYREHGDPTAGAFNEVYGKGTYEDVEFCFAARTLEYDVIYTPKAEAYHHVGASVLQGGGGYPLARNEMIFNARCGGMITWDEWRFG